MKKFVSLLFVAVFTWPFLSQAQDTPLTRKYEVGITFSGLNNFGVIFKTGRSNTLFRASLVAMNLGINNAWGRDQDSTTQKANTYGVSLQAGFEHRIRLIQNFQFLWGIEGGCGFRYQKTSTEYASHSASLSSWSIDPRISVLFGVCYSIKEHLVISAELAPSLDYLYGNQKQTTDNITHETTQSNFSFGFNSNSARLTVAYRFGK